MKTKIKILLTMAMFIMVSALAAAAPYESGPDFTKNIRAEVTYPKFALNRNIQGEVLVSFNVDEQGKIQIDGVNGSHAALRDYVVNTIKNTRVSPADNAYGKKFNMRFVFRIL